MTVQLLPSQKLNLTFDDQKEGLSLETLWEKEKMLVTTIKYLFPTMFSLPPKLNCSLKVRLLTPVKDSILLESINHWSFSKSFKKANALEIYKSKRF